MTLLIDANGVGKTFVLHQQGGLKLPVLADVYARLLAYTAYHFREEEDMMAAAGLDP